MGKTTRRDFMAYTAALASTTAACGDSGGNGAAIVSDDLTRLSATEAVEAMRSGNLAAEDYASALLARCRQGDYLNAFRTLDAEQVLEAARSADQRRACRYR